MQSILILGVPIDCLSMVETLDRIEQFIETGRSTGKGHQIATVNADFVTNAIRDPRQMEVLQKVSLAMPDGMPIAWGARLLGARNCERVAGVDVVLNLAERSAKNGYSIYLLGAAPDVANRAAEILQAKFPGLIISGVSSPMIQSIRETDPQILEAIRVAHPDILLVAFGNPKQELWISEFANLLNVPVMIGVGGTLDFISGNKKRAPLWIQKFCLEWVYRLAQEPRRLWRRYSRNIFIFCPNFFRQLIVLFLQSKSVTMLSSEGVTFQEKTAFIRVPHCLTHNNFETFRTVFHQILPTTADIIVDLAQTDYLDSSAYGGMVRLAWEARELGGDLVLCGVSFKIYRMLSLLRLAKFFQISKSTEHLTVFGSKNHQDPTKGRKTENFNRSKKISKA